MTFMLHPQLAADCHMVADLPLCRLLLMDDANYPWFILVPRRNNLREIHELDDADQLQLLRESTWLARTLQATTHAQKMNVAALGNMVPQLHIHHISRTETDAAWPAPVWGKVARKPYPAERAAELVAQWQNLARQRFQFAS